MRLSRLPVLLAAAALLGGGVACSAAIDGTGSPAAGLVTPGPTGTGAPTATSGPTETSPPPSPTAAPTPTTNTVTVRQRLLCVLERAAITSTNSQFNKSKDRAVQIRVLRAGAATISGHLSRSGLPADDRVRRPGQSVLDQLNRLVRTATGGSTPSTAPYNLATRNFQKACSTIS